MPKSFPLLIAIAALVGLGTAGARVPRSSIKLEITSTEIAYGGKTFGDYGPFERLSGVAHLRIDPTAPANRGIVDLTLAPRDAEGLVDYDVDIVILRPRDPAHARQVMLYDVVNRGAKTLSSLNLGQSGGAEDPIASGDGLLMRQGYTLVWSGWQSDAAGKGMVAARFPIAMRDGKPVTGRISTETIFDNDDGDTMRLPYPAATLDQSTARLTVQERTGDRPVVIAPADWHFVDDGRVKLKRPAGMDAGAIYHLEYVARDSRVMGLGFAATRDVIAFLRHASAADGNPLADIARSPCEHDAHGACANPTGGIFSSTVAIGGSQSARYLRDFVWQGFNRDLSGRRVFDGIIPYIAGGRATFTNFRFAEPSRFSRQHEDHDVPGYVFPFTYATLTDPVTGKRDGILRNCAIDGTCPKVFQIDTSAEFWQAGASLVGTGGTNHDVAFPANVRAYMIAGGAHAPGRAGANCSLPANPMNYSPLLRALTLAMVDWTLDRHAPPDSRWPSVADLAPVAALRAPAIPALTQGWAKVANTPDSRVAGREWPVLVPKIDADGIDKPGIHLPDVAAPTGTYLGWNLRKPGFAGGELCLVWGGYLPFAADAASRKGDSRLSLAERYPAPGARGERYAEAAEALRQQRFLLDEDAASMKKQAAGK